MAPQSSSLLSSLSSVAARSWFVLIATFLTLSSFTLTSLGQPQPQVLLVTQPEPQYYVTKEQAANITCEAYGATTITFMCHGSPVLPKALTTYQSYDESRGVSIIRTTLKVRWAEVETAVRGAGLEREGGYWCQCTAQDENRYVSVSSRRTVVSLAVLEKMFQESPESQIVAAGSQTILSCIPPHGHPKPEVSWRKDGHKLRVDKDANIVQGEDGSLTILDTGLENAGAYQCVAKNLAGRRQSPMATLIVEDVGDMLAPQALTTKVDKDTPKPRAPREVPEPIFVEQPPDDMYVTPTEPINFVCAVQGATRMTVRCNGLRVDQNRLRSQSDDASNVYRIEHTLTYAEVENYLRTVSVQHYTEKHFQCGCVAWYMDPSLPKIWGSVQSNVAKIHTTYIKDDFQAQPRDLTVQVGSTAHLICGAPKGMPQPTVHWSFEGQRIDTDQDSRYTLTEDGTLTITNVDYRDHGRYYCEAENSVGVRRSKIATVRVSAEAVTESTPSPTQAPGVGGYVATFPAVIPDSPVFLKDLDSQYFLDWDGNALLVCSVVSADMLTYRCMNSRLQENEQVIDQLLDPASGKRLLTASTIVTSAEIASVEPGAYTCQCVAWYIKAGAWQHNFSSPATILPAYIDSMFVYEPRSGSFYAGDMVEFACDPPGGQPAPKVSWLKDGNEVDAEADDNLEILEDGRLIIDRVRVTDAGRYECVAVNPAGRRKSSPAELEVYPSAATTPKPTVSVTISTTTPKRDEMVSPTTLAPVTPDDASLQFSTTSAGPIIPFFSLEPDPEGYIIGENDAILQCVAVEATRLIFFCNNERVPASKEKNVYKIVDPSTKYTILEKSVAISRRDVEQFHGRGEYVCHCRAYYQEEGTETWSFVATSNTTVKIAYLDDRFVEEPVDQVVQLGVTTELRCRPPMGVPQPVVIWRKNGFPVVETKHVRVSEEGSLVFDAVARDDTGDYNCTAVNIMGSVASRVIRLTVDRSVVQPDPKREGEITPEPTGEEEGIPERGAGEGKGMPTFIAEPENIYYIVRSKPVTITCKVANAEQINFVCNNESIPQSRVQYQDLRLNDREVMSASIDISREEVENYNPRDGKEFHCECQARYSLPQRHREYMYVTSASGYVQVAYLKKTFRLDPTNTTLVKGAFLSLTCEAPEGNPIPKVSWTKNGQEVTSRIPTPDNSFNAHPANEEDAGEYVCVATNLATTRKSRSAFVQIKVEDRIVSGLSGADLGKPTSEPETTTPDDEDSWTTTMSAIYKESNCLNMLQTCSVLMPQGFANKSACRTAPNYVSCVGRFLEQCRGVMNRESIEAAEGAKKLVETSCASERVCKELMECQSEYTKQNDPNADAETMPMTILCKGIYSFLRCAHSAAEDCKIPQDNRDTSLNQLAIWFENYCKKVMEKPWVKECESLSQCDLPIEQTTILNNLVQASLWCPYVKKTMQCTWQAVSDCSVRNMQDDLEELDTISDQTCPASDDTEDKDKEDKEDKEDGDAIPGERENNIGKSKTEDGNDNGNASAHHSSSLLACLLPVLVMLLTCR